MNGVIGMLDLALDTPAYPEQRYYTPDSLQSAKHCLPCSTTSWIFSKIEAGRLELESVNFNLRNAWKMWPPCWPAAPRKRDWR